MRIKDVLKKDADLVNELATLKRQHAQLRAAAQTVLDHWQPTGDPSLLALRAALNDCTLCAGSGSPGPYRDNAVCPACLGSGIAAPVEHVETFNPYWVRELVKLALLSNYPSGICSAAARVRDSERTR